MGMLPVCRAAVGDNVTETVVFQDLSAMVVWSVLAACYGLKSIDVLDENLAAGDLHQTFGFEFF